MFKENGILKENGNYSRFLRNIKIDAVFGYQL